MKTPFEFNLFRLSAATVLTALALMVGAPVASAQDDQVRAQPTRLTVQAGQSGVITNTIYVIVNTNETINLAVDPTLPTGVSSANLSATSFTAPADNRLFGSATLTVNYTGTVPQSGANEIIINATGGLTYRLPVPINSAVLWAGNTNNNAFGTPGNWAGGSVPGGSDAVVFGSSGAAPAFNDEDTSPGFFTNSITNVVITSDRAVSGVRFSHGAVGGTTPDPDARYRVEIQPGATLSVTGAAGFQLLQDTINLGGNMIVEITGGGALVVSNENARVTLLKEGSAGQQSWLDMETLDLFQADVDRLGFGDYLLYPNWSTNGYEVTSGGAGTNQAPSRWLPQVRLARTNVIRATHIDASNYNNPFVREYPLSIGLNAEAGTTADLSFYFGISNAFFMDAICFGQFETDLGGDTFLRFNPDTNAIPTNVTPIVVFRNADGVSPMSALVCGDGVSVGAGDNAVRGNLNLSGGIVDALVDRLYLGRDRQEGGSRSPSVGEMTIANGQFVVNTAFLGCNLLSNNISTDNTNVTETCEATGTLTVQSNAVLVVTDTMHLGYTTADPTSETNTRGAEDCFGFLQVQNGGTAMINSIVLGGGDEPDATKLSENNRVSITGGGELIVTNRIGQADKWLATFTMSDSTLTLHMDGSQSTPYVYATNVVGGGSGNTIKIASIDNVASFPTQLPVIAYESASPNFGVEFVEPNRYGYIVVNTTNQTIDVVILDTPPNNLIWDGAAGTEWSTSAANWQGGAIFTNGDTATFDDTAVNPTANVTETVYLGGFGVLVTNNTKAITLTGAGSVSGTAPMNKWGGNSLTVNVTSELPLTIHEGSVTGSGAIGSTVVRSNATLTFAGNINKLDSAGTTTLSAGGTVANGVRVTGGTFTNSGRAVGTVDASNALVQVNPGGSFTIATPSTSVIRSNATVDLDGLWTNGPAGGANGTYRIDVLGTLTGTGSIRTGTPDIQHSSGSSPSYWSRLVIGSGGVLSPGAAPNSLAVLTNGSQLDFSPGSRIIIDVNTDSADGSNPLRNAQTGSMAAKNSDVVYSSRWSTRTGTIRMNRVGTTPWTNGMVLKIFSKPFENFNFLNRVFDGTETQLPVMDPPSPGLGLLWSLQDLATNGVIRIIGTGSTPPTLVTMPTDGTNLTFSWPTNYVGWQLQTQVNPLNVGLSTNWSVVSGSTTTNSITITNWLGDADERALEIRLYRLAHPTFE